ncbi:hypothetical protein CRE_28265 [Caenorhabditis remanei]|uniref:Sdz-33 F-box domain-containing protein n=1 Tax=Caenorhabditis remanei TaxID=31234 RepID=E3LN10_CAERE|nr:hypothetical protein CRE_28265 [Caenorhabditis remanei]
MFPLLLLDPVSCENVLNQLNPYELFKFSLCSKISNLLARNVAVKVNDSFSLDIHLDESYSIGIQYETSHVFEYFSCRSNTIHNMLGDSSIVSKSVEHGKLNGNGPSMFHTSDEKNVETYWEDEVVGFKLLIEYVMNLYDKPIDILYFHKTDSLKSIEILRWINTRQGSIRFGHFDLCHVNSDHTLSRILDQIKNINELDLVMLPGSEFIKNDTRRYEFEELTITNGYWVTLPRLVDMNCHILNISGTELTNYDVNSFLKMWINGELDKLKLMTLNILEVDILKIMEGIQYLKKRNYSGESFSVSLDITKNDIFYIICRTDGLAASTYVTKFGNHLVFNMEVGK